MSLYRDANLRHATIGLLSIALFAAILGGTVLENAVCEFPPSRARFAFLVFAGAVLSGDLLYRHFFRAAAEREGWRRFVNPMSGGRLFILPLWLPGAALTVYALVTGSRAGFCG